MIVDATKSVGDTFSIMDIVYKAYMDVGGHTELLYDICSTFGNVSLPLIPSEQVPDGKNVIKDSFGLNVNYYRNNEYGECIK